MQNNNDETRNGKGEIKRYNIIIIRRWNLSEYTSRATQLYW